ncbi:g protein-coupled receptor [Anaeramoeba flamelloides]|uniref:G protein-coupled receptor n=1 Tax=Anaeramoeba flamelloides TaxID=1746091 RepID=A0ABQ8XKV5_9EUKA|nr:g protein-coupled receptor [Anaeramoeba flamelloides]
MTFEKLKDQVTLVFVILCVLGYLQIIIVYLKFGYLKRLNGKLLFTLSVYDFLSSCTFFLPGSANKTLCKFQTYISCFLTVLPPFWCATIAILTYLVLTRRYSNQQLEKLYRYLHIIGLLGSTVWMIITILYTTPHPVTVYWCTVHGNLLLAEYIWYWVAILICFIFSICSLVSFRQISKEFDKLNRQTKHETNVIQLRMMSVPLVFIWCYIWSTIERMIEIRNKKPPVWVQWMQIINFSLSGIILCLIFIWFSSGVRSHLVDWLLCKNRRLIQLNKNNREGLKKKKKKNYKYYTKQEKKEDKSFFSDSQSVSISDSSNSFDFESDLSSSSSFHSSQSYSDRVSSSLSDPNYN